MADKNYVVSLTVDDSGAVAAVNNMTTALDKADSSSQSLKAQLRQMQQELQKLDVGSEEFQKLSLQAGKLKDQINDAAEAVRANAGNAFEGLSNNASLLKDRLFNLDLEGVGQSFKGIAGNIKGISFKEIQSGIGAVGSGLASIGKALLTNPLFLLAAALGAAVAYSDELLSLVDGISEADEKQLNAQKEKAALATQQLDNISAQEEILKEQGKTEAEITDLKQQALDTAIKEQEVVIATQKSQLVAQVQAAERNRQILNGILQFITAPLQLLLGAVDGIILGLNKVGVISDETYQNIGSLRENLNNSITGLLFDPAQIQKDGEAAIKESEAQLLKLQNQAAGFRNKERDAANKAAEESRKETEKELEIRKQQLLELQMLKLKLNEELVKNTEATINSVNEKLKSFGDKTKIKNADPFGTPEDAAQLRQQLADERKSAEELELQELDNKYKEQRALAGNDAELRKQLLDKYLLDEQAIKDKYAKEDKDRQRALNMSRVQMASDAIGALSALDAAFSANNKKGARAAFNRNKAYSIAQAGIQTGLAVTAALTAGGNPVKLATGAQFLEAGIAAATGIAQIAKIASTKFNESGGDSGGGGGAPSISGAGGGGGGQAAVPTFNALNLDYLKMRPEQTPKAYVLAQDVSTAVEARDKVRDLARIN
jgi:F0F1-type ATP synthase membrane subunit b/b'